MTARPVFVAGCPRSGTSALSWAVAAHPDYWTSAETHFFYYLLRHGVGNQAGPGPVSIAQAYATSAGQGSWLSRHEVAFAEFLGYLGTGFDALMRSRSGGRQWVDGSPENVLVGEELLTMFPDGQFILLVRDPRAVCRSMLTSGFDTPWARDPAEAILTWNHYCRIGLALQEAYPGRVLLVRQEVMRGAPSSVAAAIAARLSLADGTPIEKFLTTQRVNSSFDKSSYASESPYRSTEAPVLAEDEFVSRYGAMIADGTRDMAERLGYAAAEA
jgi:hypothetical protein